MKYFSWILFAILITAAFMLLLTTTAVTHFQDERSRADVNEDGIVNILDLVLVAKYLGKEDEVPNTETTPTTVNISTRYLGHPVPIVEILLLFPNKTWQQVRSDSSGQVQINLHTTDLPMTVYASAPGFAAYVKRNWVPSSGPLPIEMRVLPDGGSVIFPGSIGYLPGLSGRLNPILDTSHRTYLYATNIAINGGQQQPVRFTFGEDLHLVDADGNELMVRIVDIIGDSVLIEYRPVSKVNP